MPVESSVRAFHRGKSATLTPSQITHIIRRRLLRIPYKIIAREINCTPDQVKHYWTKSQAYEALTGKSSYRQRQANRNAKRKMEKLKSKWLAKLSRQKAKLAGKVLHEEILEAKREANTAKPFKPGPLEW
jgi:hypothetical protein